MRSSSASKAARSCLTRSVGRGIVISSWSRPTGTMLMSIWLVGSMRSPSTVASWLRISWAFCPGSICTA
ncbi:MAG: hypothetical protein KatS3mg103_0936 [Phycisphaerales bacterium]|nr:MAG: hypothetical protein KatS3mg103_0936 [Phycisphaerales bacterium]